MIDEKEWVDCSELSCAEKEDIFGKGFALIPVISCTDIDGLFYTKVVLNGRDTVLIGDPEKALHVYLMGSDMNGDKQARSRIN